MAERLRRRMTARSGQGWAVTDYDGAVKPGRWATEDDAREHGLLGVYLLSGADVTYVGADPAEEAVQGWRE